MGQIKHSGWREQEYLRVQSVFDQDKIKKMGRMKRPEGEGTAVLVKLRSQRTESILASLNKKRLL